MTVEEAITLVEQLLERGRLTKVQQIVFRQSWIGKTYLEIARESDYDSGHIKDTGAELWRLLSKALGEKVTKKNLHGALMRSAQRWNGTNISSPNLKLSTSHVDWGEAIDVSHFYGRNDELNTLSQWIVRDRCRVLALLGMGGMGKTALSVKLAQQLQGEFEYVIWRSLRHAPSFKEKLTDCVKFLCDQQVITLPASSHEQITCLVEYLRKSRCLLILDNFDTLLQQGRRAGCYREGYEAYGEFLWRLGETQHQSCVVVTSREMPAEIAALEGEKLPIRTLTLSGLGVEAGQIILTLKGLSSTECETRQLVKYYRGNPLALKIASTSIRDLYEGSIAQFFAQGTVVFNSIGNLLEQHLKRLSAPEQQVMYWLAINRETVSPAALQTDLVPVMSKPKLIEVLESLCWRSLIEGNASGFTQQPVVMEYMTDCLIEQVCQEIVTETPQYLLTHALMKAQAKDYIRDSQIRLIVQPVLERLRMTLGSAHQIEHKLGRLIHKLQDEAVDTVGYGGGNLLNLLAQLETDLTLYDFSGLYIRQADLRSLNLHQVNFAQTTLQECTFAATFGGITCVAFNPDGCLLGTSDTNGEIYLWNTSDGKQLVACKGHNSWVWSVAFSPLHPVLASCGQDHTVKLWDITTGRCLNTLQGHSGIVTSIAFSPNAEFLASASYDRTIKLWHLATGQCVQTLRGHDACVWSVAFAPTGQMLATAGEDRKIDLWEWSTGCCVQTLSGHQHWIKAIAFSPEGQRLVSGSFDRTVKLWDLETKTCLMTLPGHTGVVTSVAFTPQGDRLASSSYDSCVKLWDAHTGKCLDTLEKHTNRVWSIAFHPQGHLLASGGDDNAARIWELQTRQCTKTLQGHSNAIYAIAHSGQHHLLASGHEDQTIKLWDLNLNALPRVSPHLQPFRVLHGHGDRIMSVAFSPDGQLLASASADRTIKIWSPHTGQCLNTLYGHGSWVWAIAVSPDSKVLASASYDHTVKLWDVHSGECLQTLHGHTGSVLALTFSWDGKTLISGGYEQIIKQWDIETGNCLHTWQAHSNRVWAVAMSPSDRYLATGGDDQTVKVWDIYTKACIHTFCGHTSQVLCIRFTTDGSRLISSSADRTIKIWDVNTGDCLATLPGHQNWVWSFNLSPDAQMLLSGSQDETIKCWNLSTEQCWLTLRVARPYEGMKIAGARGLTEAEIATLKALGAL